MSAIKTQQDKNPWAKLEESIYLILMKAGVIPDDLQACMDWAFGQGAWYVPPRDWVARWNKLHPQFHVTVQAGFVEFMFKVGLQYQLREELEFGVGKGVISAKDANKKQHDLWDVKIDPKTLKEKK
jgi:hypothetical protein